MENNIRFVLGAAIAGIFLGVAGLVFGIVSKNKADELRREFSQVQELVEKIQQVEESSSGISASASRLSRDLDSLRKGTQDALDKVSAELTRFRTDLNSTVVAARGLEEKISDIERVRTPPPPVEIAAAPEPAPADRTEALLTQSSSSRPSESSGNARDTRESAGSAGGAGEETYTIKPGDTFTRIAASQNISVAALIDANPDVDERRLQIGQKLRLPR